MLDKAPMLFSTLYTKKGVLMKFLLALTMVFSLSNAFAENEAVSTETAVAVVETPLTDACMAFNTTGEFEDGADYYAQFNQKMAIPLEEAGYEDLASYLVTTVVILGTKNFSLADCETIKLAETGQDISSLIELTEEEAIAMDDYISDQMDIEGYGVLVTCVGYVVKEEGLKKYTANITYPVTFETEEALQSAAALNGAAELEVDTPVYVTVTTEYNGKVSTNTAEFSKAIMYQSEDSSGITAVGNTNDQSVSYEVVAESPASLMINLIDGTPAASFENAICTTDYAG